MPETKLSFNLPPIMRADDCRALDGFLREADKDAVVVNGIGVEKFCGQAAQVLMAHFQARPADRKLRITDPSPALEEALTLLDLDIVLGAP